MSYITNIKSPDFKSSIDEKWNEISSEKISKEEKVKKWVTYIHELKNIGTIDTKLESFILSEYTFK